MLGIFNRSAPRLAACCLDRVHPPTPPAAVENIEGQWALAGKGLQALSPEFLVDCDPLDCG